MNPDSKYLRIVAYSCAKRLRCQDYLTPQYVKVDFPLLVSSMEYLLQIINLSQDVPRSMLAFIQY